VRPVGEEDEDEEDLLARIPMSPEMRRLALHTHTHTQTHAHMILPTFPFILSSFQSDTLAQLMYISIRSQNLMSNVMINFVRPFTLNSVMYGDLITITNDAGCI
jgi:hypothetical protein